MNITGIHPEDLFDKLEDGTLTDAEAKSLRAHLATCAVCNVDLAMRGDFSKDWLVHENAAVAPSAAKRSSLRLRALSARAPRKRSALVWSAAAAALLMAAAAMASGGAAAWFAELVPPKDPPRPAGLTGARTSAREGQGAPSPSAAAAPSEGEADLPGHEPEPAPPPAATAREPASNAGAAISKPAGAAALFSDANRARDQGELARASTLYRQLQREFPRSSEAELSRVTLALMSLDGGDPRSALAAFDVYLARPSRPLEAEALVGKARALQALGENEAERRVWQAVEHRFPGTSYARRATKRLAALGRP
jgi:TolA-binding protein